MLTFETSQMLARSHDLGLGAGVGAVRQGQAKLVMKFQFLSQMTSQEAEQVFFLEYPLDPRHQAAAVLDPVGAAPGTEAGLHPVALDLLVHPFEKPRLGSRRRIDLNRGRDVLKHRDNGARFGPRGSRLVDGDSSEFDQKRENRCQNANGKAIEE